MPPKCRPGRDAPADGALVAVLPWGHGTARHGTAWHGVAQHGMTQQSMAEIGIAWNRMAWHGRVWCGTECHSMMAQHSVTQHSMAWHDTAYRDVPCHSMTFHSVAQHAWPWGPCSPCTPASSSRQGWGPFPLPCRRTRESHGTGCPAPGGAGVGVLVSWHRGAGEGAAPWGCMEGICLHPWGQAQRRAALPGTARSALPPPPHRTLYHCCKTPFQPHCFLQPPRFGAWLALGEFPGIPALPCGATQAAHPAPGQCGAGRRLEAAEPPCLCRAWGWHSLREVTAVLGMLLAAL